MRINLHKTFAKTKPKSRRNSDYNSNEFSTEQIVNGLVHKNNRHQEIEESQLIKNVVNGATFTAASISNPLEINGEYFIPQTKEDIQLLRDTYGPKEFYNTEIGDYVYRKCEACWTQQELIVLDFDSGVSEDTILNKCDNYNLKPFWLYNTFSSTESKHKFRLLFKLKEPIRNFNQMKTYLKKMLELFPESDQQCSNLDRPFFGTNKKNYKLYKEFYQTQNYLDLTILDALIEKDKLKISEYKNFPSKELNDPNYKGGCKLWDMWLDCDWNLGYGDFQHICLAHTKFADGKQLFEYGLKRNKEKNGRAAWDVKEWLRSFDDMKRKKLHVKSCKKCNHCDRENGYIINFFGREYVFTKPERENKKIYKQTINDSYNDLENTMLQYYNSPNNPKIVINAPTGVGKTEIYCRLAQPNDIIALPTHALAIEVENRLNNLGKCVIRSIKRPSLVDPNDQQEFEYLRSIGKLRQARDFYEKVVLKYINNTPEEKACIDYLKNQKDIKETKEKILVCTQHKLNNLIGNRPKNSIGMIFVDEDPLQRIFFKEITIKYTDFLLFINQINPPNAFISSLVDKINLIKKNIDEAIGKNTYREYTTEFTSDEIIGLRDIFNKYFYAQNKNVKDPVHNIFTDKLFDKDISKKIEIKRFWIDNNKIIHLVEIGQINHNRVMILSASMNENFANLIHYDFKNIDYNYNNDNIITYSHLNLNKSDIFLTNKNNRKAIEKAERIDTLIQGIDATILSHKGWNKKGTPTIQRHLTHKEKFSDIYFFNSEGYDQLNGKNLIILGTPRVHENEIFKVAAAIGVPFNNRKQNNYKIVKNDFEFTLYTYEDKRLREIQIYFIDKELTQIIGRARTYRNNAEVHIFSNFPIKGTTIF